MVGIALFTHAELGRGLIDAVELIAGKQNNIEAVGLKHGDGADEYVDRCRSALQAVNTGDGVIVFVDFLGGTPANTALKLMRETPFPCIAGVNMPMLLEAATSRDAKATPESLQKTALDIAAVSVINLGEIYASMAKPTAQAADQDDDDF